MTRDDIIRLAQEVWSAGDVYIGPSTESLERFAALVAAAEREKVTQWMIERSYATGHGDTVEDLLKELEWQVKERELKVCAKECEDSLYCAAVTRYRNNTGIKWEIEP